MKNKKPMLSLIIFFVLIAGNFSLFAETPDASLQLFFKAETTEARNLISGFSYEMLENYTNEIMNSDKMQNVQEARKLWLVEEYYKRKADKTAADRLFYVFLAVTLLMFLIFILTWKIYRMQKNLQDQN